ncbi:hypothetical protein QOZ94_001346 [Xanthobacter agilis]|uniref:Uncharacterized protein n=1 Tax=Xanthobacter agilis TaxID=47492 RepID=A0ABU0LBU4_XANAG|nr:hypothetical protein [Xanthobacter agilis]
MSTSRPGTFSRSLDARPLLIRGLPPLSPFWLGPANGSEAHRHQTARDAVAKHRHARPERRAKTAKLRRWRRNGKHIVSMRCHRARWHQDIDVASLEPPTGAVEGKTPRSRSDPRDPHDDADQLIAIQLDLTAERRRQGRRSSQAGSYASNKCSPGPCIKAATTLGLMQGSDPSVRSIGNFKARSDLCQKLSCNVGGTWRGHPSAVSLKRTRRPSTSTRARNLMAPPRERPMQRSSPPFLIATPC